MKGGLPLYKRVFARLLSGISWGVNITWLVES